MSRRVWTKPFVKTILSGDQRKARSLERKARSYVGYLFDQMGDTQKYRTGNWNLKGGIKISVYCWNDLLGQRAIVRIFHPTFGSRLYISIKNTMQHGWATLTRVAVSPEIKNYYEDIGSLPPEATSRQWLVDKFKNQEEVFCSEDNLTPLFTDTPPNVDSNGIHTAYYGVYGDEFSRVETDYRFSYTGTGFIRHFAQALAGRGSNLDIRKFMRYLGTPPTGKSLGNHGLIIRDFNGSWDFWFTRINQPFTMDFIHLIIPEEGQCILNWLYEEVTEFDQQEKELLFAYLLASLEKEDEAQKISIELPTELKTLYNNGAWPIVHGWHWDGFFGSDVNRSSSLAAVLREYDSIDIMTESLGVLNTYLYQIEVNWGEDPENPEEYGQPLSLTGGIIDSGTIRIPYTDFHGLYYDTVDSTSWGHLYNGSTELTFSEWTPSVSGVAPVYCRWKPSGGLDIIKYTNLSYNTTGIFDGFFGSEEPQGCSLYNTMEYKYQEWSHIYPAAFVSGGFSTFDISVQRYGYYIQYGRGWDTGSYSAWTTMNTYSGVNVNSAIANLYNIIAVEGCGDTSAASWLENYPDKGNINIIYIEALPKEVISTTYTIQYGFTFIPYQLFLITSDPNIVYSIETNESSFDQKINTVSPSNGIAGVVDKIRVRLILWSSEEVIGDESTMLIKWDSPTYSTFWAFGVSNCVTIGSTEVTYPLDITEQDITVSTSNSDYSYSYSFDYFSGFEWDGSYPTSLLVAKASANGLDVHQPYPGANIEGPQYIKEVVTSWFPDIGWVGGI